MSQADHAPSFVHRALVSTGLIVLAIGLVLLVRQVGQGLLVIFSGFLLAVFLDALARPLVHRLHFPRALAVALVCLVLSGLLFLGGWLLGPRLVGQLEQLADRVPRAFEELKAWLSSSAIGSSLLNDGAWLRGLSPSGSEIMSGVSATVRVVSAVVVVAFIGLFGSLHPSLYRKAVITVVPQKARERAQRLIDATIHGLRWWLVGRFSSMAAVGMLTAIGLYVLGVPLALSLGLIAGLLSFIPFIGPTLALLPAIAVALPQGPDRALLVFGLYLLVQALEGNLITPVIQQRAVFLPPAAIVAAQVVMGVLFGMLGVIVATPFAVVVVIAVQILYVGGTLGERVRLLGEH